MAKILEKKGSWEAGAEAGGPFPAGSAILLFLPIFVFHAMLYECVSLF
jgi:hypothetical protein